MVNSTTDTNNKKSSLHERIYLIVYIYIPPNYISITGYYSDSYVFYNFCFGLVTQTSFL